MDLKNNSLNTNSNSEDTYKAIAKIVLGSGARGMDITGVKDSKSQYFAYKSAKDVGLNIMGLSKENEQQFEDRYKQEQAAKVQQPSPPQ